MAPQMMCFCISSTMVKCSDLMESNGSKNFIEEALEFLMASKLALLTTCELKDPMLAMDQWYSESMVPGNHCDVREDPSDWPWSSLYHISSGLCITEERWNRRSRRTNCQPQQLLPRLILSQRCSLKPRDLWVPVSSKMPAHFSFTWRMNGLMELYVDANWFTAHQNGQGKKLKRLCSVVKRKVDCSSLINYMTILAAATTIRSPETPPSHLTMPQSYATSIHTWRRQINVCWKKRRQHQKRHGGGTDRLLWKQNSFESDLEDSSRFLEIPGLKHCRRSCREIEILQGNFWEDGGSCGDMINGGCWNADSEENETDKSVNCEFLNEKSIMNIENSPVKTLISWRLFQLFLSMESC